MNTTTENTTEPTYWLFTDPDDNLAPNYQIAYKGTLEEIQHLIGYQATQEYLTLTPTHIPVNQHNTKDLPTTSTSKPLRRQKPQNHKTLSCAPEKTPQQPPPASKRNRPTHRTKKPQNRSSQRIYSHSHKRQDHIPSREHTKPKPTHLHLRSHEQRALADQENRDHQRHRPSNTPNSARKQPNNHNATRPPTTHHFVAHR